MIRLFFSLYIALAAAVAIFTFSIFVLPEKLLLGSVMRHYERVAEGPQQLIKDELASIPIDDWPKRIEKLASDHQGYGLDLLDIDELDVPPEKLAKLRQGKPIVPGTSDLEYMLLPLGERDWILKIAIEITPAEHAERLMSSMFHLIEKRLDEAPQSEWPTLVENLGVQHYFPIQLMSLDATGLDETQLEQIRQGMILGFDVDEHKERYFKRIDGTSQVLKIGPIPNPGFVLILDYLVIGSLALLLALAAFIWLRSLWRDMRKLDESTIAFGRGDLDTRLEVSKRSPLTGLANTFNGMAGRIQHLIGSHKELTNAVSHELRTPIARMRFAIDMLQETKSDADRRRYMDNMRADIDELDALVNELLGYARLDRGKPDFELERIPMSLWLGEIAEQTRRDVPEIDLVVNAPDGERDVDVMLEPRLMARALSNVLRNAARYAHRCIQLSYSIEKDRIKVSVDDDGPGIPEADRQKVFEPFTRLDSSRARKTGGHGLGLAIVSRIMDWHQGEVYVEDSVLGGARFCLNWPIPSSGPNK